jgi:hypothetical protein
MHTHVVFSNQTSHVKAVYISPETAHNYLEIRDYISLANYLKNIFKVQRSQNGVPLQ